MQAYSWGFGGYGRLGHAETGDELVPRIIKFLDQKNRGIRYQLLRNIYILGPGANRIRIQCGSGSVADPDPDPGSGSFLPQGSGIRNEFFPDPGYQT
jgi:Regulator of chromosome condensation (RCC1) repeat